MTKAMGAGAPGAAGMAPAVPGGLSPGAAAPAPPPAGTPGPK
jgi:hypothetical protein